MGAQRCDARFVWAGGIPIVQDRAIRQKRDPQSVAVDECRTTCLRKVAPDADRPNASIAQQVDRVEQRLPTPIHRVVARHRHDVKAAIAEHRCHRWREAAVAATGMRLQRAAL
jgi:hypothetical protein